MKNLITALWILLFIVIYGCHDAEVHPKKYPYIVTKEVTDINASGVTFSAEVIRGTDNDVIIDYGFIWGSEDEFKFSFANSAKLTNHFRIRITSDLIENKSYSCRAYLITERHTIYGNQVSFTAFGSESPVIQSFYPKSGFDNDIITLKGDFFSHKAQNNIVKVEDIQAEVLLSTTDSLTFRIPSSSFMGEASINLFVGNRRTTAKSKFTILGPEIESVSFNEGYPGEYLVVNGENFLRYEPLQVLFNDQQATITKHSDDQLTALIPPFKDQPLSNVSTSLILKSGKKSVNYKDKFIVKHPWTQKSQTPFVKDLPYQAFTYNGKAYILELDDYQMYEYNPNTDQWSMSDGLSYPDKLFYYSIHIVSNRKAYKIGGYNTTYPGYRTSSVWSYDFSSKTWTLDHFTPFTFYKATFFKRNNYHYIITGDCQVWKCDIENQQYTRLNDFPTNFDGEDYRLGFAYAFVVNDKIYVVTYGQTWQYDELSDSWIRRASNDFLFRTSCAGCRHATGFIYHNTCYVLNSSETLYRYDDTNDVWVYVTNHPTPYTYSTYKLVFVLDNNVYFADIPEKYISRTPMLFVYNDID